MQRKPDCCATPISPLLTRRQFMAQGAALGLASASGLGLGACQRRENLLRVASNAWLGYEFIYLAQELGYFSREQIRLIEMPSATAVMQVLAGNTVEAACLTLDEVLTARAEGIDLVLVAVFDVSLGADVLLAQPGIQRLQQLIGKRIGVEQTALGAVMLNAVLQRANLEPGDIEIVSLTVDRHREAFLKRRVDALITFEPVISQLLSSGAQKLFSSAEIPGQVMDVLCVQRQYLNSHRNGITHLVAGHFRAQADYLRQPERHAESMARHLQLEAAQLPSAYTGLALPDIAQNHAWLGTKPARLETQAAALAQSMLKAGLLRQAVSTTGLADARFLPALAGV